MKNLLGSKQLEHGSSCTGCYLRVILKDAGSRVLLEDIQILSIDVVVLPLIYLLVRGCRGLQSLQATQQGWHRNQVV